MKLNPVNPQILHYYWHLATNWSTVKRALRIALLVGLILNLINSPQILFSFSISGIAPWKVLLIFLVPYGVSTYSSVLSSGRLKPGSISHLDAILKCKRCRKTNFHVHIGEPVEECPQCNEKTRWKPLKIFSQEGSKNKVLKSLALFARHNPQPLFRIDKESKILGANPASNHLFDHTSLVGTPLKQLLPDISHLDLMGLIEHEEVKEQVVSYGERFYNFVFKGVAVLNSVHVYGNDITEIILAEKKIKRQSREIQESIRYAWRIQGAMLPGGEVADRMFDGYFKFYRPLNIVSGDFYWINQIENQRIIAVADSTGHGVPGAFMSILGISLLNQIILREKYTDPAQILNTLRERLIMSLDDGEETNIYDGMDISLAVMDDTSHTLTFAGAYNPLFLFRNQELTELKPDRMPVGAGVKENVPFTKKTIALQKNDRVVLFTDGYKDQIGGSREKKFSTRGFKNLLLETSTLTIEEQGQAVERHFNNWKKNNQQLDDVLVMGINI